MNLQIQSSPPATAHVVAYDDELSVLEQNTNAAQDQDQPPQITIEIQVEMVADSTASSSSSEWMFLGTNLVLEIISAVLDQLSSPSEPRYALLGMIASLVAAVLCIVELTHKCSSEGAVLRRSTPPCSSMWCFYDPSHVPNNNRLFLSFSDIYGLACALSQFVFSAIKYGYLIHHSDDPVKLSVLPVVFLACLAGSKLIATSGPQTSMEAN